MVLPVVLQRQQLVDTLTRYMTQLGLEKKVKLIPALSDYLATKQNDARSNGTHG